MSVNKIYTCTFQNKQKHPQKYVRIKANNWKHENIKTRKQQQKKKITLNGYQPSNFFILIILVLIFLRNYQWNEKIIELKFGENVLEAQKFQQRKNVHKNGFKLFYSFPILFKFDGDHKSTDKKEKEITDEQYELMNMSE